MPYDKAQLIKHLSPSCAEQGRVNRCDYPGENHLLFRGAAPGPALHFRAQEQAPLYEPFASLKLRSCRLIGLGSQTFYLGIRVRIPSRLPPINHQWSNNAIINLSILFPTPSLSKIDKDNRE